MSPNRPHILALPGDGIGPEVIAPAIGVLRRVSELADFDADIEEGLLGGAAYEATGKPLPDETLASARAADAVLMGSIGGPQWDALDRALRPERGLLGLRSGLGLFANLRPAVLYPQLAEASTLRPEVVAGLDILIVRELTGGSTSGRRAASRRWKAGNGGASIRSSIPSSRSNASAVRRSRRRVGAPAGSAPWTRPTSSR